MHTPDHNPNGYDNSSINDMSALQENVRFTIMHGVSDDNVHLQNTLVLLDKLDIAGVENYDVHVFPDSDHSINFHNAHKIVYDRELPPLFSSTFGFSGTILIIRRPVELASQCFQWRVAYNRASCSRGVDLGAG